MSKTTPIKAALRIFREMNRPIWWEDIEAVAAGLYIAPNLLLHVVNSHPMFERVLFWQEDEGEPKPITHVILEQKRADLSPEEVEKRLLVATRYLPWYKRLGTKLADWTLLPLVMAILFLFRVFEPVTRRVGPFFKRPGVVKALKPFAPLLFVLTLMAKVAVKGKSLVSLFIMIGVYAYNWGLSFAVGFGLLLAIHEGGHWWVMRRYKLPAGAPVFIPFVGALIAMKGEPENAWIDANVGIGGPLLGTVGALLCLLLGYYTDSDVLQAVAHVGFILNLFNLLPIHPLDGGRILSAVSNKVIYLGLALGLATLYFHPTLMLTLIVVLGFTEIGKLTSHRPSYNDIKPWQRVTMGGLYASLAAFLVFAAEATTLTEDQADPLKTALLISPFLLRKLLIKDA